MNTYRLGVDIGGTFTDIVFIGEDGELITRKVSSSVGDYARAIAEGLAHLFEQEALAPDQVTEVLHGTTVASNAILEHKGARAGLITTSGFRDVLELRNLRMPRLYDLHWEKPTPLIDRYLRLTVTERINADGSVAIPLDLLELEQVVDKLAAEEVEIIAVCLINSYANPAHELAIKQFIEQRAPHIRCCISYQVLPEIKEYERTSTTVVNAYVLPVVTQYLDRLQEELEARDVQAPLLLMQSNGGLIPAQAAAEHPVHIIESGPAGGVVGAQALAQKIGLGNVISFDMGGTTAKASMVERGAFARSPDFQVGGGILTGSRLLSGAGYLLKVPAIDLAEVGAGGGSHVWIDAGGAMQVGPESAGAEPGPVCYGKGGLHPTITDANLVLGYLNPTHLVGGAVAIDKSLSEEALRRQVSEPLGLSLEQAALGAHQIAASNMMRAIRAVSSERGRDPRSYALFAFGGNGPLFAASMARALGMREIVVPPSPGLFSAFGLLYADVEHHFSRSLLRIVREADPGEFEQAWGELEAQANAQLEREGFAVERRELIRAANLHYKGQIYELSVPAPRGDIDSTWLQALEQAFGDEHEQTYGHRASEDEPVELVNVELIARGLPERPRVPTKLAPRRTENTVGASERRAYFGESHGWLSTRVLSRAMLDQAISGPCIIEEYDATCLVPPGVRAALDEYGNIRLTIER